MTTAAAITGMLLLAWLSWLAGDLVIVRRTLHDAGPYWTQTHQALHESRLVSRLALTIGARCWPEH